MLLATIDAIMLRMLEDEGRLRRQRALLRMAATQLRTGRVAEAVLALLIEQEPALGSQLRTHGGGIRSISARTRARSRRASRYVSRA